MTAIIIPIESEGSSFSEVLSNVGFLTGKVFLKNHRVTFHKKIQSSKSKLPSKRTLRLEWEKQLGGCAVLKNYEQLRISS